jgi:hypothetical protein
MITTTKEKKKKKKYDETESVFGLVTSAASFTMMITFLDAC